MNHDPARHGHRGPTSAELEAVLASLDPREASRIRARARPAPSAPPTPLPGPPPPPAYTSWQDFLAKTTAAERHRWCAQKAKKANGQRLMSGRPQTRITADDVLAVLTAARGRCTWCGSLAVENRPTRPGRGGPAPWAHVGRRIGSLGHRVPRFEGGDNTSGDLVWTCLWCNTWPSERFMGATDHGGLFPDADLNQSPRLGGAQVAVSSEAGLRRSQLAGRDFGGRFCAYDGDDGACPITPNPHMVAKGVPRDGPAGGCAMLGIEFPRTSQ